MKEIWVKADPWQKELVTAALEAGADAVIVPDDKVKAAKELGIITTVAKAGDLKWEKDVVRAQIRSREDEKKIACLSRNKKVVVDTTDWTIIPLENLVARSDNIFVTITSAQEANTALGILEKGVAGIIIEDRNPAKVKEIIGKIKSGHESLHLVEFTIESVVPAAMGDRVCVDTCTMMKEGDGLLVGNSSQGLFLIHCESVENPYVSPRPFRVNAGPVHAYVMVPGGKTRYLCELKAGDLVMGVNAKGKSTPILVGRVKIERRPLLLIQATGPNGPVSTIVQNAETIRLVAPQGNPVSVVHLKAGNTVLGYVEKEGRHFGYKVHETITEK
ncbi:MAG: 3-dehydroquinate synthase II [Deltaproteobacteria bacterium]|nr:3-dehydroquinate synthase II [Deltaproteobacteria bacterium]MBW1927660.1 3-dehydroquinate synthase II [Deltaproteobacteria bacterium]RLB23423.1 MAG: 3-dehydroquinate synthase II [Deltaproteobacteria bacterium]